MTGRASIRKSRPGVALCAALGAAAAIANAQPMQIPKPSAGLMPSPVAGKKLFAAACVQCHGVDLRGTKEGPSLVHRIYEPAHHGDVAFQIAVKYGSRQHHWRFGDMKPVPGLSPDEVAHITSYVRAEQRKAGIR
ncbi:MAG: cytochrome c [Burkholderiales bacterium]